MKAIKALSIARQKLKQKNITSYQIDALILLSFLLNLSKEQIIFNHDLELDENKYQQFLDLIKQRLSYRPVSQIIGKREFFGEDFIINSSVLDPRPDSETLIEATLDIFKNNHQELKILELGIGSGCLLLTLLKKIPSASGVGIDIDNNALKVAAKNAELLKLQNRINLVQSDWFNNLKPQKFDLIISNPPYIPTQTIESLQPEVKDHEPRIALDGGNDGLDCYVKIASCVNNFLKNEAVLMVEIGQNQKTDVTGIFKKAGLQLVAEKKDLGGIVRCLGFKK